MWSDGLTKRQAEILEMINDCVTRNGFAPSIREIADAFEISSPNGVVCHLKALEKKGFLSRRKTKSRAIELSKDYLRHVRGMPLKGEIAAGDLNESMEARHRVDFGNMFDPEQNYALQVRGDSMIDAHICDGDYVVVKPSHQAESGQIVVARTHDGQTTVKYWFPEDGRVRLQPGNATMGPIYSTCAEVVGVVVGVVRQSA